MMRTTLNISDELLSQAQQLTGLTRKTALVQEGLRALIERESFQPNRGARAAAALSNGLPLWTRDKRLRLIADHLHLSY